MRPYESDIYKPNRELNHGNQTEIDSLFGENPHVYLGCASIIVQIYTKNFILQNIILFYETPLTFFLSLRSATIATSIALPITNG